MLKKRRGKLVKLKLRGRDLLRWRLRLRILRLLLEVETWILV